MNGDGGIIKRTEGENTVVRGDNCWFYQLSDFSALELRELIGGESLWQSSQPAHRQPLFFFQQSEAQTPPLCEFQNFYFFKLYFGALFLLSDIEINSIDF